MSNLETKLQIREAIKQHCIEEDIYYREVDSQRILTRCPCCGDSSNPNHAHFYIIIDPNTNINAGYICFKCGAHGPLTPEILSMMGIQKFGTPARSNLYHHTTSKGKGSSLDPSIPKRK